MAVPNRVNAISLGQSVNPQILNFSREEFRQHQLSATKQSYDKIVVGAAVLRDASAFHKIPSILLLKRAAHEVYFPSVFKLPGGKVDPDDPTIKHASRSRDAGRDGPRDQQHLHRIETDDIHDGEGGGQ
ncbi:hypothetical protein ACEPPN_001159 [Leptodophora sp. 'Broadleaf-Isolate-01']